MAFEDVSIQSVKTPPGGAPVIGWRQDLAIGDTLVLTLTSIVGVSSFRWLLVGRPEGSVAGGVGPEPINLGSGSSASFVVDNDSPYHRDGTYIVHCIVNEGSPTETRIRVGLSRLTGLTTTDGRVLRMLGGFEIDEDTADPLVRQGYNKALERWFRKVVESLSAGAANANSPYLSQIQFGTAGHTSGPAWDMVQLAGELPGADPIAQIDGAFDTTNGTGTATHLLSRAMCATMHQFGRDCVIDAVASYILSWTAGGFLGMAIYANATDGTLSPGVKLWQQDPLFDSVTGQVNYQEVAVSPTITVHAGDVLWFAQAASSNFDNGPAVLSLHPTGGVGLRGVGWKRPAVGALFGANNASSAEITKARNFAAAFGPHNSLGALSLHFVFPDPFPVGAGFDFASTRGAGQNNPPQVGPAVWFHATP